MKPLIGITVGEIQNAAYLWGPVVYGQNYDYCEAVEAAGGIPCLIPLMNDFKNLKQLYKKFDGILFTGGGDINPTLYKEKPYPTTVGITDRRDAAEVQLCKWALQDKKPILGICRGMQMLNVVSGGTLYQDIATDIKGATDHTVSTVRQDTQYQAHHIQIEPMSQLASILNQQTLRTNSHHHQAVKVVGRNLDAVAWTEDGVIEALETKNKAYVIGLQCHPESLQAKTVPELRKLFESFVAAASSS